MTTAEQKRIKDLKREVRELRRANEILKLASAFFAQAELDRNLVRSFIDQHSERFRVEPICRVLQVAPTAYWRSRARQRDPSLSPPRARRDAALTPHIRRIWETNLEVYGADKVWHPLKREHVAPWSG